MNAPEKMSAPSVTALFTVKNACPTRYRAGAVAVKVPTMYAAPLAGSAELSVALSNELMRARDRRRRSNVVTPVESGK